MWVPSRRQRAWLAIGAVVGLGVDLSASFFGPASVATYGPPVPGATAQIDLMIGAAFLGGAVIGISAWRSGETDLFLLPFLAGIVGVSLGAYFFLGFWAPTGSANGGEFTPLGLQGAVLFDWGLASLLSPLGFEFLGRTHRRPGSTGTTRSEVGGTPPSPADSGRSPDWQGDGRA